MLISIRFSLFWTCFSWWSGCWLGPRRRWIAVGWWRVWMLSGAFILGAWGPCGFSCFGADRLATRRPCRLTLINSNRCIHFLILRLHCPHHHTRPRCCLLALLHRQLILPLDLPPHLLCPDTFYFTKSKCFFVSWIPCLTDPAVHHIAYFMCFWLWIVCCGLRYSDMRPCSRLISPSWLGSRFRGVTLLLWCASWCLCAKD